MVSLEVPASLDELFATMAGFLAFAVCFAFIVWIWVEHRNYDRSFAFEDPTTIFVNSALLLVVPFYVDPLKFLFHLLRRVDFGLGPELRLEPLRAACWRGRPARCARRGSG